MDLRKKFLFCVDALIYLLESDFCRNLKNPLHFFNVLELTILYILFYNSLIYLGFVIEIFYIQTVPSQINLMHSGLIINIDAMI